MRAALAFGIDLDTAEVPQNSAYAGPVLDVTAAPYLQSCGAGATSSTPCPPVSIPATRTWPLRLSHWIRIRRLISASATSRAISRAPSGVKCVRSPRPGRSALSIWFGVKCADPASPSRE